MPPLRRLKLQARAAAAMLLVSASRRLWRQPLGREETFAILKRWTVRTEQHDDIAIPRLPSLNGTVFPYFDAFMARFSPNYIWDLRVDSSVRSLSLCRSGTVLVNGEFLLNLDFGAARGVLDAPWKRRYHTYDTVVVPWTHLYGTYYDFIIFVLSKLCRIEHHFGPKLWHEAIVCYPLLHTAFETEFLDQLGIPRDRIVDTKPWQVGIQAQRAILGNSQAWFTPSPRDLQRIRERFLPAPDGPPSLRLYVSRGGSRRVRNESEVRQVLQKFDFHIVEDGRRSVAEQIRLFQRASALVGPHGAGLTNMLWCNRGTPVLELFQDRYMPPFYYHLSYLLGHPYRYLVGVRPSHRSGPDSVDRARPAPPQPGGAVLSPGLRAHSGEDMIIDPAMLARAIEMLVSPQAPDAT